jgi:site-specific DNA-methyltransferase (adenine-specific)
MAHLSEDSVRLEKQIINVEIISQLQEFKDTNPNVFLFYLPIGRTDFEASQSQLVYTMLSDYCATLNKNAVVCVLATPSDAARLLPVLEKHLDFKVWIAVKTTPEVYHTQDYQLPQRHLALLILTRYQTSLQHTKTRIAYTYCPYCKKTTKDYGGKKHLYHQYGTAISDVWRDIECNPFENIDVITDRLQDLFGLTPHHILQVLDLHNCLELQPTAKLPNLPIIQIQAENGNELESQLLNQDCLEALRTLPDSSINFCFADPPYNLKKKYSHWDDSMESRQYFVWCDQWLSELARVLKPGGTLTVMNIPLWAVRYYQFLASILNFQSWIAWDAMSYPVRHIMPSHYTVLCFSKGLPRALPGLKLTQETEDISPMKELFCVREHCLTERRRLHFPDRSELYDIWYDIHRVKHNGRRVDHPCQLPPQLMRRLFALFTQPGEIILDCFNGAGTSTLVAAQMDRRYIGIELSPEYHSLAIQRHLDLQKGRNPFAKKDTIPTAKNSKDKRQSGQKYDIPKKTLQLDVKRIAQQLGRLPTRDDVRLLSAYPYELFEKYFSSWGEVCAAARTTGMSELPSEEIKGKPIEGQLSFSI